MATKARRRLMLATLLAMFWSSSDDFVENEFSVREGDAISMSHVQETLQRLAPDLYQNVFGALNEVHYTEDGRPPKSVVVSLKKLITEITSEMTPTEFVAFSLETSRRDLIHQLSDVSHQEFRLKVLRSLQSVASALIRLHMLDKEMLEPHLSRPTLLGAKVKFSISIVDAMTCTPWIVCNYLILCVPDDSPLNQDPYWPHFQVLSDEELSVEVRRGSLPMF